MTDTNNIMANTKIKDFIHKIHQEYEFQYMFTGEKFKLVNNLNLLKKPVLILAPENDDPKYEGKLKLCAYGGTGIAVIDTKSGIITLPDNEYSKYLEDGYSNDKKPKEYFLQEGLFDHLDESAESKYKKLRDEHNKHNKAAHNDEETCKIDDELLDLSAFAAYTRFLNRTTHKEWPAYPQERSIQCVIAKNSMLSSKYGNNKYVVIDIETHLFDENNSTNYPRADFVVFDGESFGLIEFKYLGLSMDGSSNNLTRHYKDFVKALTDAKNAKWLFEQLKMKLQYLMAYELIDKSWFEKGRAMCKKEYSKSRLWCGFYFLGDKTDIPEEKHKKKIVKDRIIRQLKDEYNKAVPAKCGISEIDENSTAEIKMDYDDISEIWRKLLKN